MRSQVSREAFASTPRHVFVPRFFRNDQDKGWVAVDNSDPDYLDLVYAPELLIVQLDEDPTAWERLRADGVYYGGWPSSSSSSPALMAIMLEALDIRRGHSVLEIGTGTGYNAAILAHYVGDEHVTSVDVDATLVRDARMRLAASGHGPRLATCDAMTDIPAGPYDRIEVTVAVAAIPQLWIDRTRPGGHILVNLASGLLSDTMFALTVDDHGIASGSAIADAVYFMPTRAAHLPAGYELHAGIDTTAGVTVDSAVEFAVTDDHESGFRTFLALAFPDLQQFLTDGAASWNWLIASDQSWVHDLGDGRIRCGGPRNLWPDIERLWTWWNDHDRPTRHRLGLTTTVDSSHSFWLDSPINPIRWA